MKIEEIYELRRNGYKKEIKHTIVKLVNGDKIECDNYLIDGDSTDEFLHLTIEKTKGYETITENLHIRRDQIIFTDVITKTIDLRKKYWIKLWFHHLRYHVWFSHIRYYVRSRKDKKRVGSEEINSK
jgi:hypothetical protein